MSDVMSLASIGIAVPLGLALIFVFSIGIVWFAWTSGLHRTFGAGVVLIAYLIDSALVGAPSVTFGLNISTNDVAALLLLLALAVGAIHRPLPLHRPMFLFWLSFAALLMMNLAIGLGRYGSAAGNEIRPTFGFLIASLYFCANDFTQDEIGRIARWCLWAGYTLVAIAVYRWVGMVAGFIPMTLVQQVGASNEFRVLGADGAFYLAMLALVQFMIWLRGDGTRLTGFHALFFGTLVLVLQHRSVWVSYALGFLFILMQQYRHLPRRLPVLLVGVMIGGAALAIAAAFGMLDRLVDSLVESSEEVGARGSTATWRLIGWEILLSEWMNSDTWTVLFGFPFGYGFRRFLNGIYIEHQPHNFYVFMLLRAGILGTLLFVVALVTAWLHAVSARTRDEADYVFVRSLGVMMLCSLVFYVPYQGIHIHGALTGLALGLLICRAATPAAVELNRDVRPAKPSIRSAAR